MNFSIKLVKKGDPVPVMVEGGVMTQKAPDHGVVFTTKNGDAIFVSHSDLHELVKLTKGRRK